MAELRRKEKNCLTNDVRNSKRRIQRYLQLVEPWNIEQVYRTIARFAGTVQRNIIWTMEITDDFEKNVYTLTNLWNIHETRGKQDEKLPFGVQNYR